jgi:transcriptional regulator with XRE-family HTH domain
LATLAELRQQAGFPTPEHFAIAAILSPRTVRMAENGEVISLQTALRIAAALHIPYSEIRTIDGLNISTNTRKRKKPSPR